MNLRPQRNADPGRRPMRRLDDRAERAERATLADPADPAARGRDTAMSAAAPASDGATPGLPTKVSAAAVAGAPATTLRLSFTPLPLPAAWATDAPLALRQARALADDERLAAAALYLWLRNRALDHDGAAPLVLQCDRGGRPILDAAGAPTSLGGTALDHTLLAAMAADR